MHKRSKCSFMVAALSVRNLGVGIAIANGPDRTQVKTASVIQWYPSNEVVTYIYHETLPRADILMKAYRISLQGANAAAAIKKYSAGHCSV